MPKPCSGIREIDEDPELNDDLIPILEEALKHIEDIEFEKEGLVYRTEKWRMIVKFDDDHVPEFAINKWGYGKFYIYIPRVTIQELFTVLIKTLREEIERIKELSKEFECKERGEKGVVIRSEDLQ